MERSQEIEAMPSDQAVEILYQSLVDLIRHIDRQITRTSHFHFTAMGALLPILGYLLGQNPPWGTVVGIVMLAIALAVNWSAHTSKLGLQKLCLVRHIRKVEPLLFKSKRGPFLEEEDFFRNLLNADISMMDKIVLNQIGFPRLKTIPIVLLLIGIIIMVIVGFYL